MNRLCVAGQYLTSVFNQPVTHTHAKLPSVVEQLLFTYIVINLLLVCFVFFFLLSTISLEHVFFVSSVG